MASDKNLIPDCNILSGIPTIKDAISDLENTFKDKCQVISNNWTTCTFRLRLDTCPPGYPEHVLIRLETSNGSFTTVAALQNLAHSQLPGIVPRVLEVGTTTSEKGQHLEYSITEFVPDTVNLEEEWNKLDSQAQKDLISELVASVQKLQSLSLSSEHVQKALDGTSFNCDGKMACIGGPKLGYFSDMAGFLKGIGGHAVPEKHNFSVCQTAHGFIMESTLDNIGRVELTSSDLIELQQQVVFCHNDLEPRNILIKREASDAGTGPTKWSIAAIVDWEMAGFYPFAYEYGYKDKALGSSNLLFTWYMLFKEQSRRLLPGEKSAVKLLEALRAMDASDKLRRTRNVGRNIQVKWFEREKLEFSSDMQSGWVRKAGVGPVGIFTKEVQDDLEDEVLKELGIA